MEILKIIITNILTALYQPFWFALILSFLLQFFFCGLDIPGENYRRKSWIWKSSVAINEDYILVLFYD